MRVSVKRAIRRVSPPGPYLVTAISLVVLIESLWLFLNYQWGAAVAEPILLARDGLIAILAIVYGVFRCLAFHPFVNSDYREWLGRTPWIRGQPLPLGSVHPVLADLVIVLSLAVLMWFDPRQLAMVGMGAAGRISGHMIVGFALFAHTLSLSILVWLTRPRKFAYIAMFLLGACIRASLFSQPSAALLLIAAAAMANSGLRQSLDLFPWPEPLDWLAMIKSGWKAQQTRHGHAIEEDSSPDRVPPAQLGWPFGVCSPYVAPTMVHKSEKALMCVLAGWWLHAGMAGIPVRIAETIAGAVSFYAALVIMIKAVANYGGNHMPPINFVGRLLTFRWIIRSYDRVIAGPLGIILTGVASSLISFAWLGWPPSIWIPFTVTTTLWAVCFAGPDPTNWKLTSATRLVPGRLPKTTFDELS